MIKLLSSLLILISASSFGSNRLKKPIDYKTYFGSCPSRVAGKLTLRLAKVFEQKRSLKAVKEEITENKLKEKFFLSDYSITHDPVTDKLKFKFDCPAPVMKVQIYKNNGDEFYTAILVDNGELFDPTYEVMLRSEKILRSKLPNLAMPVKVLDQKLHLDITRLIVDLDLSVRKIISEVIISENNQLTMILSVRKRPTSVFLGSDYWSEKVDKLTRVIAHMKKKKSIPSVINLTNSKKVVVKF
ncbi:MAG: hypothetical protein N4A33_09505 [Bacteriovoracaceae bacterium]|jgi:hypothetical protein|nr:hypothetical protein [Bacteriovoracaceae bacterium]